MRRPVAAMLKLALVLSAIIPMVRVASGHQAAPGCAPRLVTPPVSTAMFSLDGVELELSTSFLSDLEFAASDPNTAVQVATAAER